MISSIKTTNKQSEGTDWGFGSGYGLRVGLWLGLGFALAFNIGARSKCRTVKAPVFGNQ